MVVETVRFVSFVDQYWTYIVWLECIMTSVLIKSLRLTTRLVFARRRNANTFQNYGEIVAANTLNLIWYIHVRGEIVWRLCWLTWVKAKMPAKL